VATWFLYIAISPAIAADGREFDLVHGILVAQQFDKARRRLVFVMEVLGLTRGGIRVIPPANSLIREQGSARVA
jgi:hypothetical protein